MIPILVVVRLGRGQKSLEESFIGKKKKIRMSSSCTGVYTCEMAVAIVLKVVNDSEHFPVRSSLHSMMCHDFWSD